MKRYEIRNEYGAGEVDLYKSVDKDDPEILLEGIAMAGLVGVLRQLGDLAEFAAEIFHDLHEDVMATAARGHDLMARVHQLEAEVPFVEKSFVADSHLPYLTNPGVEWHASLNIEHNTITRGTLPRFVMDSCEECRGPPRLFLLDKFDVAGAGACLKRYTDPAFFKAQAEAAQISNVDKKSRKIKKKASRGRRGDNPESAISSNPTLHDLFSKDLAKTGHSAPTRLLKIKRKFSNGFQIDGANYIEKFRETILQENSSNSELSNRKHYGSGHYIHEISVTSPVHGKELALYSFDASQGESENEASCGNTDAGLVKFAESNSEIDTEESFLKIGMRSEDTNSEMGIYLEALASAESENEPNDDLALIFLGSSKSVGHVNANLSDSRSFGHSSASYESDILTSKGRSSVDILSNASDAHLRNSRMRDGDDLSCSSSQIDAQFSMASVGNEVSESQLDIPCKSFSSELVPQVEFAIQSERAVNNNESESRSLQPFASCSNEISSGFQETDISPASRDYLRNKDITSYFNSKKMADFDSESNNIDANGVLHSVVNRSFVDSKEGKNANANFENGIGPSVDPEDFSTLAASNDNQAGAISDFRVVFSSNEVEDDANSEDEARIPHTVVASPEKLGANAGDVVCSDARDDAHSFVASTDGEDRISNSFASYPNHTIARSPYDQEVQASVPPDDLKNIADEITEEIDSLDEKHSFSAIPGVAGHETKALPSPEWEKEEISEPIVPLGGKLPSSYDGNESQSETIGVSLLRYTNQISGPEITEPAGLNTMITDNTPFQSSAVPEDFSIVEDLPPLPPLPPMQWRMSKVSQFMQPPFPFHSIDDSVSTSDSTRATINNHIWLHADHLPIPEKEMSCDFEEDQQKLDSSFYSFNEDSNLTDVKSSQNDLNSGTLAFKFRLPESGKDFSNDFDDGEKNLNSNLTDTESSRNSEFLFPTSESGKEIVCDSDDTEQTTIANLCRPLEVSLLPDFRTPASDPHSVREQTTSNSFPEVRSSHWDIESIQNDDNGKEKSSGNHLNDHDDSTLTSLQPSDIIPNSESPELVNLHHSNSEKELSCDIDEEQKKFHLPSHQKEANAVSIEPSETEISGDPDVEQKELNSDLPNSDLHSTPAAIKTSDATESKSDEQQSVANESKAMSNGTLPWSTNTLSLPPAFGVGKLNKSKQSLPRNPLIDAAAAVDKSKMRKVTKHEKPRPPPLLSERDSLQLRKVSAKSAPKTDERDSLLEQIRTKSFNLKPASTARPTIQSVPAPKTNLKVAAILEKANAIRQALAGSDDSDDSEDWADS